MHAYFLSYYLARRMKLNRSQWNFVDVVTIMHYNCKQLMHECMQDSLVPKQANDCDCGVFVCMVKLIIITYKNVTK